MNHCIVVSCVLFIAPQIGSWLQYLQEQVRHENISNKIILISSFHIFVTGLPLFVENLEKLGNSKMVREMSAKMQKKIWDFFLSGYSSSQGKFVVTQSL